MTNIVIKSNEPYKCCIKLQKNSVHCSNSDSEMDSLFKIKETNYHLLYKSFTNEHIYLV